MHRHYQLPSLTSLTGFKASARRRSIKLAARELNVTPGAISRQIKALENAFSRAAEAVQRIDAEVAPGT